MMRLRRGRLESLERATVETVDLSANVNWIDPFDYLLLDQDKIQIYFLFASATCVIMFDYLSLDKT